MRDPRTEWQPIETAPMNGTDLLLACGESVWLCMWNGLEWVDSAGRTCPTFTHWMLPPIPPPTLDSIKVKRLTAALLIIRDIQANNYDTVQDAFNHAVNIARMSLRDDP